MQLLDINVLIALVDPAHRHHRQSRRWFVANQANGWATCPITENGMVRILSSPSYPGGGQTAEATGALLTVLCGLPGHVFWPDEVSIRDSRLFAPLSGPKKITDSYLLALAVKRGGRLITFDRKLDVASVVGGELALWVIS